MAGGRGRGQGHPGGEDGRRPAVVPPAPGRSGERWSQACPGALKLCGRTGASAGLHLGVTTKVNKEVGRTHCPRELWSLPPAQV